MLAELLDLVIGLQARTSIGASLSPKSAYINESAV